MGYGIPCSMKQEPQLDQSIGGPDLKLWGENASLGFNESPV